MQQDSQILEGLQKEETNAVLLDVINQLLLTQQEENTNAVPAGVGASSSLPIEEKDILEILAWHMGVSLEALKTRLKELKEEEEQRHQQNSVNWEENLDFDSLDNDFYTAFCRICRKFGCRVHIGAHPRPVVGPVTISEEKEDLQRKLRTQRRLNGQRQQAATYEELVIEGKQPCGDQCYKLLLGAQELEAEAGEATATAAAAFQDEEEEEEEEDEDEAEDDDEDVEVESGEEDKFKQNEIEIKDELLGTESKPIELDSDGNEVIDLCSSEEDTPMETVREGGEHEKEANADAPAEGIAVGVKRVSSENGGNHHDVRLPAFDAVLAGISTGVKKVSKGAVEKQAGTNAQIAARAAAAQAAPPSRRMSPSSPPKNNNEGAAAVATAAIPTIPTTRPTTPADQLQEQQQHQQEGSPPWQLWEDAALEQGLEVWGRQPCKIAVLVGSRTCAQVRQRMMTLLNSTQPTTLNERNYYGAAGVVNGNGNYTTTDYDGDRYGNGLNQNRRKRKGSKHTNKQPYVVSQRHKRSIDELWPQFQPCGCIGPCKEGCPCVDGDNFCEKFCGCDPALCGNRFQGCQCKCGVYFNKRCTTRQCPCLAAGRECDPDLCKLCIPTLHNANEPGYQCNNFRIRLRQKRRVLMGLSDVQGWGAFLAGPAVKKDGFIGEYCGELISHLETERRGKVYDLDDNSYLFNLNEQWVIDAWQKGNKFRFANHSTTANCRVEKIVVDGDHRVAILANQDLLPGDELFYDYKYELTTDMPPDWAQQYRGGGRGARRGGRGSRGRREHSVGAGGRRSGRGGRGGRVRGR